MKIAIQPDLMPNASFSARWVERLQELGHDVELVSVRDPEFFDRVKACDGFLWWFPPFGWKRHGGFHHRGTETQRGTEIFLKNLSSSSSVSLCLCGESPSCF